MAAENDLMARTSDPLAGTDRYATVFRHLHEAVLICDPAGRIVEVNPAAERLFGYAAADLVGTFPGGIRDPDGAALRADAVRLHLTTSAEWSGDVSFHRRDGERRVGRSSWTALYDPPASGEVAGYLGLTRDVTEELVTAVVLAETELRWRLTFDAAPIGMALVGLDGSFLRVNSALCEIVGYSEPDLLGCTFQDITHADDLDADLTLLGELFRGEIDEYTLDKRYGHSRGHYVWVRLSVALVRSESGDPLHYIAQIQDVTAARLARQRLTAIIASARDAFISIDRSGLVTEWNAAAEQMFGWSRAEAVGVSMARLVMGPRMAAVHDAGLAGLSSGADSAVLGRRLELTAVRRGGEEFPVELTAWRADDAPDEFHAFVRDIGDRVRAQERAVAFTARQQAIVEAQLDIAQVELTPSKVMQRICEQAANVTNATGAVIELRDGDDLVCRSGTASMRHHLGLRLGVEGSLSGMSAISGRTLICTDTGDDPRVDAAACRAAGVGSVIVSPLRHGNAIVGVLTVLATEAGQFDTDDAGALELLAAPFATAMTNARRLEETSQQALSDPMTGLANRAYALHELERTLARQRRHGGHTAVIFVDLDRFKAVNDTWGHAAGDELLSAVAERLRQTVRTTDTPARYGGDEFVIVCEGLTAPGDAVVLAERLVGAIPGTYQLGDGPASIGASVGVAVATTPVPAAQLLRLADEAMYEAKQAGGSRYSIRTVG
ncbi:MAG: diguanylate cyclase [Frankiales bacterium]|nr:diguanylate cyclase [Frankiales bacterium]